MITRCSEYEPQGFELDSNLSLASKGFMHLAFDTTAESAFRYAIETGEDVGKIIDNLIEAGYAIRESKDLKIRFNLETRF